VAKEIFRRRSPQRDPLPRLGRWDDPLHIHVGEQTKSKAVRLAKKYDGNDTGSFVNGILGSFARSLNPAE
jgi:hypothetical protein